MRVHRHPIATVACFIIVTVRIPHYLYIRSLQSVETLQKRLSQKLRKSYEILLAVDYVYRVHLQVKTSFMERTQARN